VNDFGNRARIAPGSFQGASIALGYERARKAAQRLKAACPTRGFIRSRDQAAKLIDALNLRFACKAKVISAFLSNR